jgi:hypothetical protein
MNGYPQKLCTMKITKITKNHFKSVLLYNKTFTATPNNQNIIKSIGCKITKKYSKLCQALFARMYQTHNTQHKNPIKYPINP